MIVVTAENIRLFIIMVLGGVWLYLLIETLAEESVKRDKRNK
tara:strand:- start:4750 stop:4875 length:126 start_codon:yes stop_codon:yes gene_type:complete